MNWKRVILLMLPIRLRRSRFFYVLLWALTRWTRRKYDEQEAYTRGVIEDMRYTSQYASLEKLLQKRFGGGIEIVDDEEVENITYVRPDKDEERTYIPMIVRNDREVVIKRDFIVLVPSGVDKEQVRVMIERYVFCGIYFEVREK
ncbi:MAG: hypothetical protein IJ180_09630 [Bacteroidales bacterium]|nr:hypothetical protein [Bacteroidales bacterium]